MGLPIGGLLGCAGQCFSIDALIRDSHPNAAYLCAVYAIYIFALRIYTHTYKEEGCPSLSRLACRLSVLPMQMERHSLNTGLCLPASLFLHIGRISLSSNSNHHCTRGARGVYTPKRYCTRVLIYLCASTMLAHTCLRTRVLGVLVHRVPLHLGCLRYGAHISLNTTSPEVPGVLTHRVPLHLGVLTHQGAQALMVVYISLCKHYCTRGARGAYAPGCLRTGALAPGVLCALAPCALESL